jgi:hypothetical protein
MSPVVQQSWLTLAIIASLGVASIYEVASITDLVILVGFTIVRNWRLLLPLLQNLDIRPFFGLLRGVVGTFLAFQAGKFVLYLIEASPVEVVEDGKAIPMLFPARTSHTRFFPKTHSFSYSYLLAGIPVGWKGSVGGMLEADRGGPVLLDSSPPQSSGSSWYSVNAEDYLDRGFGHLGLDGKLKKFLQTQVISISQRSNITS